MRPAFGVAVLALILVALVLRILMMAPSYAFPGGDELGYLSDGLLVLEGITPGYKFAPAGLLTWFSFVYGGVAAAGHVLAPSAFVAGLPGSLKLLGAFDSGLFAIYRDMSDLHFWVVVAVMLVSLGGVFAAARLGHKRAGFAGLLVAGGLMAALPIVVSLSVQSRPYALAWSLALMAIGFAGLADGRLRSIGAGICFGLAVSSRIDMRRYSR
ncbi:MAG: hypothetical protein HY057_11735 [Rhodospirillales bacterium]|nr:hypothetical protein [Rhodospirillales bacterium]